MKRIYLDAQLNCTRPVNDWSGFWTLEDNYRDAEYQYGLRRQEELRKMWLEYSERFGYLAYNYRERLTNLRSIQTNHMNQLLNEVYGSLFRNFPKDKLWTYDEIIKLRNLIREKKNHYMRDDYPKLEDDDFVDENADAIKAAKKNLDVKEYMRLRYEMVDKLNKRDTNRVVSKSILCDYDIGFDATGINTMPNKYYVQTIVVTSDTIHTFLYKKWSEKCQFEWARVYLHLDHYEEEESKLTNEHHVQLLELLNCRYAREEQIKQIHHDELSVQYSMQHDTLTSRYILDPSSEVDSKMRTLYFQLKTLRE
jgi:hypothetical protein